MVGISLDQFHDIKFAADSVELVRSGNGRWSMAIRSVAGQCNDQILMAPTPTNGSGTLPPHLDFTQKRQKT